MYLIFDTETTGRPNNYKAPITDTNNWPRMVQLAWQLHDYSGKLVNRGNFIVKPDGYDIPFAVVQIHGITTEIAVEKGHDIKDVLKAFQEDLTKAEYIIGHNIEFDINIVGSECYRYDFEPEVCNKKSLDTMQLSTEYCALPGGRGGKYKWPQLGELHEKLFGHKFAEAHDAAYDVDATSKCFFGLLSEKVIKAKGGVQAKDIVYQAPELETANFNLESEAITESDVLPSDDADIPDELKTAQFAHLHCRSQFSVLQSTSNLNILCQTIKEHKGEAIAVCDNNNLYGAFHFTNAAEKAGLKAIIGLEINICDKHLDKSNKDNGHPIVLLAKNKNGYKNLIKLSSKAFTEGFYYVPRVDRETLLKYKEDLIVLSGGLWGEVPFKILNLGSKQAEEAFKWWHKHFGSDYYAEIQRHGLAEEDVVNKELLKLCETYNVKYVASNNSYYTDQESANAQDILLCVKDAENQSTPSVFYGSKGRDKRFGLPNKEFYVKSPNEMKRLFADLPEAILNIAEVLDKTEAYSLKQDVLLPKFNIPQEFLNPEDEEDGGKRGENAYLKHLAYQGAKERYGDLTDDIIDRIEFELSVIANSGYPGYFLIVEDFIREARKMGVSVGPGRGSAAGSVVAYCVRITNIDPIKYDLLFERFLNPDRISMPDIDIDFDDEGRQKVIDYVIDKYGSSQVAQIITFGTMAAKSAIKDAARVLELPLNEANNLAKLIPGTLSLHKAFTLSELQLKEKVPKEEERQDIKLLKKLADGNTLQAEVIRQARLLEGSVRNTGIHACGVIITPDDLTNFVPVATAKDSNMYCTQFDNSVVEDAGLLKMDFLGLKTLSLIKVAIEIIYERHGIKIDPDEIPLDDEKTYALFQRGETNGIFQYESPGMRKHLKALKPTVFEDLIAMNALYRPGPIEYIPNFIDRKHGREETVYDLEDCKEHLEETYGITVYQEQVMLLSQKLASFTRGEADTLRKAMGKKQAETLAKLKPKFLEQGSNNGHATDTLEKIWKDWEAFASYAFNKSHSTCYAYIAFQTAYLKAHYPAEYMASVLSNNLNNIKSVTLYMEECKNIGVQVLNPDVNESNYQFSVNKEGNIRFGMGAIKGVGRSATESIVAERNENGQFTDIFDFFKRVDYRIVNKKAFEALCMGGAFDCFTDVHRAQLLEASEGERTALETLVRFGQAVQQQADAPPDLFGDSSDATINPPILPEVKEWSDLYKLKLERDVVGFYITGHPLDIFSYEIENFGYGSTAWLENLEPHVGKELRLCGTISGVREFVDKKGNPFGRFVLEDYDGSHDFALFRNDYTKFKNHLVNGSMVMIKGKVQKRPYNEMCDLNVESILPMSTLMATNCKALIIKTHEYFVNKELIDHISKVLTQKDGKTSLRFVITDYGGNKCVLKSGQSKYNITGEMLKSLEKIPNIELSLTS